MKIVVLSHGSAVVGSRGFRWTDFALLVIPLVAVYFAFPSYPSLASYVVIMAMFALSLDVALGLAGIVTLGHAVFFGVGAYAAGLLAIAGWQEPITGVLLAACCAAALALVSGPFVLRLTGLPQVMVTLLIAVLFYEAGNKMGWLTGGDDGLQGIVVDPIFGLFEWSIYGTTKYVYASTWLVVIFFAVQRMATSPFGLALRGIRENRLRMQLIGSPVMRHLMVSYMVSAFIAGIAGALLAQTTEFVGLGVLSVETSIDVVVMLVLGGVGHLFGALLGTPLYLLVKDLSQQWNPHAWMIVIGCLLVFVTLFARGGLFGLLHALHDRLRGRNDEGNS